MKLSANKVIPGIHYRQATMLVVMLLSLAVHYIPTATAADPAEALVDADVDDTSVKELWESTAPDAKLEGEDVAGLSGAEEILNPPDEYHYAAFGKPDPFVVPFAFATSGSVKSGAGGGADGANGASGTYEIPLVSPLQVELNILHVKGIWEISGGERKALIGVNGSGAAMQGVIAKVGDPIGLSGKIIKIDENAVVTRQYRLREDGSREFEDVSLKLGTSIPSRVPSAPQKGKVILEPGKGPKVKYEDNFLIQPAPVNSGDLDYTKFVPKAPNTKASQLPANGLGGGVVDVQNR